MGKTKQNKTEIRMIMDIYKIRLMIVLCLILFGVLISSQRLDENYLTCVRLCAQLYLPIKSDDDQFQYDMCVKVDCTFAAPSS